MSDEQQFNDSEVQEVDVQIFTNDYIPESSDISITSDQFDPSNIKFGTPVSKDGSEKLGIPPYIFIPMTYEYDIEGVKICKDLVIISPLMFSPRGITENFKKEDKERKNPLGKSLGLMYNITNPLHKSHMDSIVQLYILVVRHLCLDKTRDGSVGTFMSKVYRGFKEPEYDAMTDPNLSWNGCTYPINYSKQGDRYNLNSEPSFWSNLKRSGGGTKFAEKTYMRDASGTILLDKDGKKRYKFTGISPDVLAISSLKGYACHKFLGINVTPNGAKIKHELESFMVKKIDIKETGIRSGLGNADKDEEDESYGSIAQDGLLLLPAAAAFARKRMEREAAMKKDETPLTSTPPTSVAAAAAATIAQSPPIQQMSNYQQPQIQYQMERPTHYATQQFSTMHGMNTMNNMNNMNPMQTYQRGYDTGYVQNGMEVNNMPTNTPFNTNIM